MMSKRKRHCTFFDEARTNGGRNAILTEIWTALRKVQRQTGCTTKVLKLTLKALSPFLKDDISVDGHRLQNVDRRMHEKGGATKIELHGCIGANCNYIFTPSNDNDNCVKCGHPRFNDKGEPNEVRNCFVLSVF